MSQILRPDATIARNGWTDQALGTTDIHLTINEVVANDADFIRDDYFGFFAGPPGEEEERLTATGLIKIGLSEPAEEPDTSGVFTVRVRHQRTTSYGGTLFVTLKQGATTIAIKSVVLTTALKTSNFSLSVGEKAKIVTGGGFELHFQAVPQGGTGSSDARITFAEFEIPDAVEAGGGGEDPPPPPPGGSSPDKRELKAWTFNHDGHHFYVLNLGDFGTIVFDITTGQWCEWVSDAENRWVPSVGKNWNDIVLAGSFNSDEVFSIKSGKGFDLLTKPIVRLIRGLLPMRVRTTVQCKGVYVTGSARKGATVQLRTSDDGEVTFTDHGTITIT